MNNIEEILNTTGFIIYHFKGISMLPLLEEKRDLVKIIKIDKDLKIYDPVLFKRDNGDFVLHRIVGINDDVFDIVGDNQNTIEKVNRNQIIGIAVGKFRDNEYIEFSGKEYDDYVKRICKDINKREIEYRFNEVRKEYIELFKLVKAAINNKKYKLTCNHKEIFNLVDKEELCAFTFNALNKNEVDRGVYSLWEDKANGVLRKNILYDALRKKIYAKFNEENIKYMSLKGIVIKDYYPLLGLRNFTDNDILYDSNRYLDVKRIMESFGFEEITYGANLEDVFHKDDFYSIEMHKGLFTDEFKNYNAYFGNVFDDAIRIEDTSEYKMTDLNFYLYFLAHMYKHDTSTGIGLRLFVDLYYIRKHLLDKIDEKELNEKLNILGLKVFHNRNIEFLNNILNENYEDAQYINYVLTGNVYGTLDNYIRNSIHSKGKFKYIINRLFPPVTFLRGKYKILRKCPILLPMFWIIRLFEDLFNKKHLSNMFNEIKILNENKTSH